MAPIKASRTAANPQDAPATETLASRRFLAYAAQAEAEGKHHAAALFREIAERKGGHAERPPGPENADRAGASDVLSPGDVRNAGDVRSPGELRSAGITERRECNDPYPGMARTADLKPVVSLFANLAKAGRSHVCRFRRMLETLM